MIAKPNFHSVFAEFNRRRNAQTRDEVQQADLRICILDISKICLYEFHHEYMLLMYREKYKIMYTDTDSVSLIYHILGVKKFVAFFLLDGIKKTPRTFSHT